MRFSRNPTTGSLELYTDEGEYVGVMATSNCPDDSFAQDGGPGSGNYGHSGRPGKVGGSAPGGGKQYRGGRSDIGYFNSKKDWLNGLSGEKQAEATRLLKAAREQAPEGYDKTPEEYIMKEWPIEWKEAFVKLVGESRHWDEKGGRLQAANLDPQDWYALWALGAGLDEKYAKKGETLFSDKELENENYDRMFGMMDDEEKQLYLDLKAKACGLPTSGKKPEEYSGPFQRRMGYIDKPVPPKTEEENKVWADYLGNEEKNDLRQIVTGVFGESMENFVGETDMNAAELNMIKKLLSSVEENGGEEYIEAFNEYLAKKAKYVNSNYFEDIDGMSRGGVTKEKIGSLSQYKVNAVQEILESMRGEGDENLSISKDGDILEMTLIMDISVPQEIKASYLAAKARALGLPKTEGILKIEFDQMYEYGRNRKAETGKRKLEKEKAAKFAERFARYHEERKKNIVVVPGDSFSEKVNSMRKEDGKYTSEDFKKIGEVTLKEYESLLEKQAAEEKELRDEYDRLADKERELADKVDRDAYKTLSDYFNARFKATEEISKQMADVWTKLENVRHTQPIAAMLKRVRNIGPSEPKKMKEHLPGRSTVKESITNAYDKYPREWCDASMSKGPIITKKVDRGYYSHYDSTIGISGWGFQSQFETAIHELGHRFERVVPGIVEQEREFFESRTKGEEFAQLRKLTGGAFGSGEKAKKDNFVNAYIGRDNGGDSFEVVSMGFEYAFTNPRVMFKDPEYAKLILGILTVG